MEERLKFLASGTKPKKNKEAMKEVLDELRSEGLYYDGEKSKTKSNKKKKDESSDEEDDDDEDDKKKKKKDSKADKKKDKKAKKEEK